MVVGTANEAFAHPTVSVRTSQLSRRSAAMVSPTPTPCRSAITSA